MNRMVKKSIYNIVRNLVLDILTPFLTLLIQKLLVEPGYATVHRKVVSLSHVGPVYRHTPGFEAVDLLKCLTYEMIGGHPLMFLESL